MTAKIEIVEKLGEQALLLPSLLAEALAANDRVKLRLTLLQEAAAHARHPEGAARDFSSERRAAGLADGPFDTTVAGAKLLSADQIYAPSAAVLLKGVGTDLDAMLAPLKAATVEASAALEQRCAALVAAMPAADNDSLSRSMISMR